MAIQITGEIPGMTTEQYDRVSEALGASRAGDIDGLICHTACVADRGMVITDVWESQDHFERFINERLMPAFQQVGVEASGMEPTISQVHNHME